MTLELNLSIVEKAALVNGMPQLPPSLAKKHIGCLVSRPYCKTAIAFSTLGSLTLPSMMALRRESVAVETT